VFHGSGNAINPGGGGGSRNPGGGVAWGYKTWSPGYIHRTLVVKFKPVENFSRISGLLLPGTPFAVGACFSDFFPGSAVSPDIQFENSDSDRDPYRHEHECIPAQVRKEQAAGYYPKNRREWIEGDTKAPGNGRDVPAELDEA